MRTPVAYNVLAVFLALPLLAPCAAWADRAQIESILKSEYQNKVVILRGFYSDAKLRFGSNGKPVGKVNPGYWSSDGMLQVTHISLDRQSTVLIRGTRVVDEFDDKAGAFRYVDTKRPVEIGIELDRSWHDATPVRELLGKMFSGNINDMANTLPDYWQWCMAGGIHADRKGAWGCGKDDTDETSDAPKFTLPEGTVVYRAKNGVKPPTPITSFEPSYTENARQARLEGISRIWMVVDVHGIPSRIRIVRPLGGGLDDRAVEAVRQWKFNPAILDGHPVPFQSNVVMNFHLY